MGLALLAVYGTQFLSSWKLANVACVIISAVAVLVINYLYYMNIMPGIFKELAGKLSNFTGLKDPLIVLINLIISLLCIGIGIFMGIYRLKGVESEE